MSAPGKTILPEKPLADLIDIFGNEEALIESVCSHLFTTYPHYDRDSRRVCREDMLQNLRYVACAVAAGRFDLLHNYILWLRTIFEKRGIPVEHLAEALALLREHLHTCLEPALFADYRSYLNRAIALLDTPWESLSPAPANAEPGPPARRFLELILAGDRHAAESHVLGLLAAGQTYADVITDVIQPALAAVGRAWQENTLSVAQEHLVTAITHGILARCLLQLEPAPERPASAVFACVAGNRHSLGLLTVTDAFELEGWQTHFLGADVPTASLLEFIQATRPALVGLSVSLPQNIVEVKRVIDGIRTGGQEPPPAILAGGHLAEALSPLLYSFGVDAVFANARDCLRYAAP